MKKSSTAYGQDQARRILPKRKSNANKSHGGRSLIIAGSEGMHGAGVLAATAAARVGSGYVQLFTNLGSISPWRNPDFLTADSARVKIGSLKFSAAAVGPGLGQSAAQMKRTLKWLDELKRCGSKAVVVDADGLNAIAKSKRVFEIPSLWIITPHEGELARLLGVRASAIVKDRAGFVRKAQQKFGCIVLLKGHRTLVADGHRIYEIQSGNAALAKAGTGDVLTGVITGFLAQGLSPVDAACLGAYVHGLVADEWVKDGRDYLSLMATDLLSLIPKTLAKVRKPSGRSAGTGLTQV